MTPSPEDELTLLCAGTTARRHSMRERMQQLIDAVDWVLLAETLRTRRLLATLGPRVLELAGERVDAGFATAVHNAIVTGCRQDALLQLVSERIAAALWDAGIQSAALKGPHLAETIYGEPGRRRSTDIDLLVGEEHLPTAVRIVRQLGYGPPRDHVGASGLPLLHFALVHERGELPPVELHWRIHWYERSFARERLLPRPEDELCGWRPAMIDQLAALLLFYARDGFIGLRLAVDLAAWWDAFGTQVHPDALDALLANYPSLTKPILAAMVAGERVTGLPAAEISARTRELSLRERVAVRMAEPLPRASRAQLYAEMGLVDWLLAPPGDFGGLVQRHVMPPRDVRAQRALHAGRKRSVSSLGHGIRVVGRYGLAIMRLPLRRR